MAKEEEAKVKVKEEEEKEKKSSVLREYIETQEKYKEVKSKLPKKGNRLNKENKKRISVYIHNVFLFLQVVREKILPSSCCKSFERSCTLLRSK